MTDIELTRLCAEAMGLKFYNPLHDDAQAMALVKRFSLRVERGGMSGIVGFMHTAKRWRVLADTPDIYKYETWDEDMNRAIVECVANMQAEK